MITVGHLKISVAIVLLLGWAIFGNSKCVPKKRTHVSKYYTVITMTGGEVSTQTVTMDSLPTTGTNSTSASSIMMSPTMPSDGSSASSSSPLNPAASVATTMQSSTSPLTSSSSSPASAASSSAPAAASSSAPMSSGSAPPDSSSLPASGSTAPSGASATPSNSSSSSTAPTGNMQQGTASYYTEWKSNPGSCGFIPSNGNIAAVNPQFMPAKCKQCIMINYSGKSLKVQVTDTCPGCSATQIDLSDVAFQQLDSLSKGKLTLQWGWVDC